MPIWNKVKRNKITESDDIKYLSIDVITDTHLYSKSDDNPANADGLGAVYKPGNGEEWHLYAGSAKLKHFVDFANNSESVLALHLGDFVQDSDDLTWDLFTKNWGKITKEKEITIGNHDIGHGNGYARVVEKTGYTNRPEIARSKFNRSFVVSNGSQDVRVIMMDSTIDTTGEHVSNRAGYYQDDAIDWLDSELATCVEENVVIFTHHGPHLYTKDKFLGVDAYKYEDVLYNAAKTRNLKINTIFGHHHPIQVEEFDTLPKIKKGYCLGGNLLFNPAPYYTINVYDDGTISIDEFMAGYPYP